ADDLLGAAEAVGSGGVDPVDAQLERPVDRRDRLLVLLRAPAELPAAAADSPRAEADAGDLETGMAQLRCRELCLLHCLHRDAPSCGWVAAARRSSATATAASAATATVKIRPAARSPSTSARSPSPTTGSEMAT